MALIKFSKVGALIKGRYRCLYITFSSFIYSQGFPCVGTLYHMNLHKSSEFKKIEELSKKLEKEPIL